MFSPAPRELAVLDQATRLLAAATSLDEIKAIRDKAEAARTYVKAAQLGLELQNRASELKIRAERKAGRFLRDLKLRGGDRRPSSNRATLKLEDFGISWEQSCRWQKLASISERNFESYIRTVKDHNRELTSAGLLRLAGKPASSIRSAAARPLTDTNETSTREWPRESLAEMLNHFHLLGDVLRPVYEEQNVELKPAEKRIIRQLIGEIRELIEQLLKNWPSLPPAV
jgi:hypothetical protein